MANDMLERLKAFLETEEGKKSISEFAKKYARDQDHKARWVEKFKERCEGDLNGSLKKLMDKYYSDEYRDREYKMHVEPREPLLWLAYEYATKYCKPYNGKKYTNMFTADAYHFGSYVIQLMIGQGSALRIDKK
jgi:hypothetical protein